MYNYEHTYCNQIKLYKITHKNAKKFSLKAFHVDITTKYDLVAKRYFILNLELYMWVSIT